MLKLTTALSASPYRLPCPASTTCHLISATPHPCLHDPPHPRFRKPSFPPTFPTWAPWHLSPDGQSARDLNPDGQSAGDLNPGRRFEPVPWGDHVSDRSANHPGFRVRVSGSPLFLVAVSCKHEVCIALQTTPAFHVLANVWGPVPPLCRPPRL